MPNMKKPAVMAGFFGLAAGASVEAPGAFTPPYRRSDEQQKQDDHEERYAQKPHDESTQHGLSPFE